MYATRFAFVRKNCSIANRHCLLTSLTPESSKKKMSNPISANTQANTPPPLNFIALLRQMLRTSDKVSDLIFSPGRPPQIELAGKLQPVQFPGLEKLTPAHTTSMAKLIIGNHNSATESLETSGSADLSFSAPGEARFRVNIFKQRGSYAIVMRVIPTNLP